MKREKNPNQRAFKIVTKKQIVISKPAEEPVPEIDTAKAVAFAMSIAQEMKQCQREADEAKLAGYQFLDSDLVIMQHGTVRQTSKCYNTHLDESRKVLWKSGSVAQPSQSEYESSKEVPPSLEGKYYDWKNTDVRVISDGRRPRTRRGIP